MIELVISSPINCVYKPETEAVKAVIMYCESYTCCCHLYQICMGIKYDVVAHIADSSVSGYCIYMLDRQ